MAVKPGFVLALVGNPKDRFCFDEAQINLGPSFCEECHFYVNVNLSMSKMMRQKRCNPLMGDSLMKSQKSLSSSHFRKYFVFSHIMLTCLCNVEPLTPHYYIEKTGVNRGIQYFLIFALKHRLRVLVRT